jgi:hypothetical protein
LGTYLNHVYKFGEFLKIWWNLATENLKKDFTMFNHVAFWLYIYNQQKEVDACIHSKNQKLAMAPHENGHMLLTCLVRNPFCLH